MNLRRLFHTNYCCLILFSCFASPISIDFRWLGYILCMRRIYLAVRTSNEDDYDFPVIEFEREECISNDANYSDAVVIHKNFFVCLLFSESLNK